jgi:hypothetical protein
MSEFDTRRGDTSDPTAPPSIYQQAAAKYRCACLVTPLRRQITSDGRTTYRFQCQTCGKVSECLKKSHPAVLAQAEYPPLIDDAIRERWQGLIRAEEQRLEAELYPRIFDYAERQRERRAFYESYLLSPEWKARRTLVLARDAHLCQACRVNRATQVHHLSYAHLGREPLFELVSVCKPCHELITAIDHGEI